MNRSEIDNDHWVERYLAGRLSETETRRFEAYWIENPDLTRDIENGARLKSGLAGLRATGQLGALVRASWWSSRMRLLVLAASVAVVAIGVTLWSGTRGGTGVLLAAAPTSLPGLAGSVLPRGSLHTILRLRSAASVDAVITLPDSPRAVELRILPDVSLAAPAADPGRSEPPPFVLTLTREGPDRAALQVGRVEPLVAGADGFVTVFIDSRTLPPARYRLRIESTDAPGGAGGSDFLVDVRDGPPTP